MHNFLFLKIMLLHCGCGSLKWGRQKVMITLWKLASADGFSRPRGNIKADRLT